MKAVIASFALALSCSTSVCAQTAASSLDNTVPTAGCRPGVYGNGGESFVVIGPTPSAAAQGQRYLFLDGRRGRTGAPDAAVVCANDVATIGSSNGQSEALPRRQIIETEVRFESAETILVGRLIEPSGPIDTRRPLVIMVHGSEKTPALQNVYAYMLVAQGISVFVYDKRGTGLSAGEFTMNFELLADDAAAALDQARRMAVGRFGRSGFFGGSQGGWVAPLAATKAAADFVAVGFGLVISPIEEDRAQLLDEARRMNLDARSIEQIERLSDATSRLLLSHFESGFEELDVLRQEIAEAPWASRIEGEYSGDMVRMSDADLRRIGRARFDNLEIIWDYDARAALTRLKVPLLWILAAEDREAPTETTRAVIRERRVAGQSIDAFVFPATDHGMFEFTENSDGTRVMTRVTDGYLRLLADWVKEDVNGTYGRAERLN
jgi:uncharacterized protein